MLTFHTGICSPQRQDVTEVRFHVGHPNAYTLAKLKNFPVPVNVRCTGIGIVSNPTYLVPIYCHRQLCPGTRVPLNIFSVTLSWQTELRSVRR